MATTWSARPLAHLGPIKKTLQPRPPHALMHDAHSPMHGNEYYFILRGGERDTFMASKKEAAFYMKHAK